MIHLEPCSPTAQPCCLQPTLEEKAAQEAWQVPLQKSAPGQLLHHACLLTFPVFFK